MPIWLNLGMDGAGFARPGAESRCHAVLEWTALAAHSSSQALPAIVHRELAADRKAPPHDCCYCYANAPRERWPSPKKRPFPTSIPLPPLSGSSSSEDPSRRFPFPCSSIVPDWL
ncbi:uncharacterized protein [Physcomitrium patens]|uniref:uncharacterized protein isoform X1 n=1 Tax=Physcomitrium patens TaxID=3218 RepID=UPI003CCE50AD